MKTIATKEIIKNAWSLFKERWGLLLSIFIVLMLIGLISGIFESVFYDQVGDVQVLKVPYYVIIIYTLVSVLIGIIVQIGLINMFIGLVRGAEVKFSQIIGDYRLIIPYFLGSLLYGIVVLIGFILLIIPGIVWSIKYSQMLYLIVDKRMGIMDAFRKSGEITYGSKWDIAIVGFAFMLVIIVSAIPLGLGLLATLPMSMLIPALIYTRLLSASEQPQEVPNSFEQAEEEAPEASEQTEGESQ